MEDYIYRHFGINLGLKMQLGLTTLATGLVLWALFFSDMQPTHDFFHHARHSIGILSCH
ncbi:MAG: hypothetical protein ACE5G7_05085 [Candidatus Hydrothermarchaeaceae archaeon]